MKANKIKTDAQPTTLMCLFKKLSILLPNNFINAPNKKNLSPLPTKEAKINAGNAIETTPAAIVNNL